MNISEWIKRKEKSDLNWFEREYKRRGIGEGTKPSHQADKRFSVWLTAMFGKPVAASTVQALRAERGIINTPTKEAVGRRRKYLLEDEDEIL